MAASDFHTLARERWVYAVETLSGPSGKSATWSKLMDIIQALDGIVGENRNHTLLPDGGGYDFKDVKLATEDGCLDFVPFTGTRYRVRPASLHLEVIASDMIQSFFLLELGELKPWGVYPPPEPSEGSQIRWREELLEVSPGKYVSRYTGADGGELPEDARPVNRYMAGKLLFVAKGSIWNRSSATYDGRHAKMSAAQIRAIIEAALSSQSA